MKRLTRAFLVSLSVFLLWGSRADSQPVTVIGPITPGHCTIFSSTTVLKDSGFACPSTGPALVVGSTTITGGTSNGLLFNNAGVLGNLATANNGVLVTSGSGAPSISTTLPSALTIPSPALTVIPTAPTAAFGTNTTQIATTAFVQTALAPCLAAGAFPVGIGSATQCSTVAGSTAVLNGGPLTVNPTALSITRGLVINQTGPASASTPGPQKYNLINLTSTAPTSGSDPNLGDTATTGFRVDMTVGGAATSSTALAGWLKETIADISGGDRIAVYGLAYSNIAHPSTGVLAGGTFAARLDDGAVHASTLTGVEIDVGGGCVGACSIAPTAVERIGLDIRIIGSSLQGSTTDSAFRLTSASGSTTAGFKNMFLLSHLGGDGGLPLATTASMFSADAAYTVANVFNLSNMTVTGSIAKFASLNITGAGTANFGSTATPPAGVVVNATVASGGGAGLLASTNTTAGVNGLQATDSQALNTYTLYANEAARTATSFGLTVGNYVSFIASGTNNLGLILGTTLNTPLYFGTNNIEHLRIAAGGNVTINSQAGGAGTADALLTVNDNNGATVAPIAGTAFHVIGSATGANVLYDSYAVPAQVFGRRADGTRSSPSAVQANDRLASWLAIGYGATGYIASSTGGFAVSANQNFTDAAAGTYVDVFTTPNGSTAAAATVRAHASGALSVGTTATDPGTSGVVNASIGYRIGNAAASGNVLRGNGTNFISAQLAVSDLSGLPVTLAQGGTNATACANTNGVWYYDGTRFVCNVNTTANSILVGNNAAPIFSASPTIGTSVTTPIHIGGTAAGSTAEIRSTSGTGSGDKVIITGGTNGGTTLAAFLGSAAQTIIGAATTNQTTPFVIHSGTDRNTGIGNAISLSTGNVIFSINDANTTFQGLEFRASQFMFNDIGGGANSGVSIGTTTGAGFNSLLVAGHVQLGSTTAATLSNGELGFAKITASGTAPGAGGVKVAAVAGTNAGTCKLIIYAGTSTTPVTIVDNVGSGC